MVSAWVRVTHLPTGLQADCHANGFPVANAFRLFRGLLWQQQHGVCPPGELPLVREYLDAVVSPSDLDAILRARFASNG